MPDTTFLNGIYTSAGAGAAIMVILIIGGWLWTRHSVDEIKTQRDTAIAEIRAQLEREIAEKHEAGARRDEAVKLAQDRLLPMLASFTATTSALIPLLQDVVKSREAEARGRSRER